MLQQYLYDKVNRGTIDTLPRTLMLLGEFGCGKHTLVKHISEKFNIMIEDISGYLFKSYLFFILSWILNLRNICGILGV